jgi:hypothetical protein
MAANALKKKYRSGTPGMPFALNLLIGAENAEILIYFQSIGENMRIKVKNMADKMSR